jgi:hypothetical protein
LKTCTHLSRTCPKVAAGFLKWPQVFNLRNSTSGVLPVQVENLHPLFENLPESGRRFATCGSLLVAPHRSDPPAHRRTARLSSAAARTPSRQSLVLFLAANIFRISAINSSGISSSQ